MEKKFYMKPLPEMDFTDKESYLQWAAAWKAQYRELSQEIRELKQGYKQAHRDHAFGWKEGHERNWYKDYATRMIELRGYSKAKSWTMKNYAKTQETVPVSA